MPRPRPRRTDDGDRPEQLRAPVAPDDLRHAAYAPATAARRRALLAEVKAGCEDRPGTYRMLGATGLVLYVGKAKRLRTRLLSYFRSAAKNRRRDKQARILRHAHALAWEYAPDEFAALLRELRLIKQHRPRFNVLMNTREAPRGWLALTGGGAGHVPALRVVLRSDDPEAVVMYGPFRRLHTLGDAARALADATGVRDCALGAGGGAARGGCLRAELGGCACPGRAAGASAADYAERVALARDFLAGRTRAPLDTLRARMLEASDAWQFERAAALRERAAALAWLAGRLERFHAGADRLTFVYRPVGVDGTERVYLIRRGTVRAECPAPAAPADEAALSALARRVYTAPDPADVPTHDLDEFYLVASWFRRHPEELARTAAAPAAGD
jgi:excinuclease UvrABC nuclease subunit